MYIAVMILAKPSVCTWSKLCTCKTFLYSRVVLMHQYLYLVCVEGVELQLPAIHAQFTSHMGIVNTCSVILTFQ